MDPGEEIPREYGLAESVTLSLSKLHPARDITAMKRLGCCWRDDYF